MTPDAETRRCLLELVYQVLPEEQAAPLHASLRSDAELAQSYSEAESVAGLLAEASKLEVPRIELRQPDTANGLFEADAAKAALEKRAARRAAALAKRARPAPWTRLAHWIVGLAAVILLAVSAAGYCYHRRQVADISADHLRLMVFGPSRLRPGVAEQYTILTAAVNGDPVSAQIEFTVYSPDRAQVLMGHKEKTDEHGDLRIDIPADAPLSTGDVLKIVATYNDKIEQCETRLNVEPIGLLPQLSVDQPVYRPGELIRYRSLTLSRFFLTPEGPLSVEFELRDPQGKLLSGSQSQAVTVAGVGSGQFSLPGEAPEGRYTLVAKSPDGRFPSRQVAFSVQSATEATAKSGKPPSPPAEKPAAGMEPVEVAFYPEGGDLVADLENRVYFLAKDGRGRPIQLTGQIVDDQGEAVATVETVHEGMGTFSLEPRAGESYRLRIESPAAVKVEPKLPEVVARRQVVLTTGVGVFPAGEPLEFNVRVIEDDRPLLVAAYCRGVLVGYDAFLSGAGANEVTIDADDLASGVIHLVVFDYGENPPRPIAQRLVYRRPATSLQVHLQEPARLDQSREKMELSLSVTNEEGQPVEAVLGAAVVDKATRGVPDAASPQLPTYFLLSSELPAPEELPNADFYLSNDPKAAVALDLLLGTRGWHRLADAVSRNARKPARDKKDLHAQAAIDDDLEPPAVFDNLLDLQKRFQQDLSVYRTGQTEMLSGLTTLSFFGGAGLLLLATMLTLMNVATGLRVWIPAVVSSGVCLFVGTILVSPEALAPSSGGPVPFVPYQTAPKPPRAKSSTPNRTPNAASNSATAVEKADNHGTLYWNPCLRTDAAGRAKLEFDVPQSTTDIRVRLDAQGADRIGSFDGQFKVRP
jgi:hypothetical protein